MIETSDKHSQNIDQAIAQIAGLAHMNVEEAKEFMYFYLESQVKGQNRKELHDENVEGVFTQTATALNMPLAALKTTLYDLLRTQHRRGT
jgi:FtsZ-binding cell division protein ZapB